MSYGVIAVVLAAGRGMRMGGPIPKQYMILRDKPVLAHTLAAFDRAPSVDGVMIVTQDEDYIRDSILTEYPINKPLWFVRGGTERQESVWNAINSLEDCQIVAIHDGVRPLIAVEVIEKTIEASRVHGAAAAGMPVKDTIKVINDDNFIERTPDRSRLWLIQTPQVFKLSILREAHTRAQEDSFLGTDDSSLVERLGYPVKLVEGQYTNIKITTPEDILIAEQIIDARGNSR